MQISNNNPTNPPHTQPGTRDKGEQPETQSKTPDHRPKPVPGLSALMLQDPTVCQPSPHQKPTPFHTPTRAEVVLGAGPTRGQASSTIPLVNTTSATRTDAGCAGCVLLRKEVIQPHLPVRLPCYDFVLIASPTFDGSLHKGWATGFGCCRLS